MFFDDEPLVPRKAAALRAPPLINADWRPPSSFPNLSSAVEISYDVETKETDFSHGPGWARGRGHIVGFSLGARDILGNRGAWYFPIRHEVEPEYNLDPDTCLRWLRDQLDTPHIPKVGANILYDNGWLSEEGIRVTGQLNDVQFAEAILDEEAFVGLDHLAHKYLGEGKRSDALYQWLSEAYGGKPTGAQRANIYRASPRLVGPYGEGDAQQPLDIIRTQWRMMESEELTAVYRMECDLVPLLIAMRRQGVQIDLEHVERLAERLRITIKELYAELSANVGMTVISVDSNALAPLFDRCGVPYPRTRPTNQFPNGKPSFQKEWLKSLEHPLGKAINNIREHEKVLGTFVESYLLNGHVNGKVHCQFHPLRGEDGGAKTGRFASSDPNLQNIPVRTEIGKEVRKAFIPFYGHKRFRKIDYSQIEYRMLAHYAINEINGDSADRLRQHYNEDPEADYHDVVQENVKQLSGLFIERRPIKNINFGLLYGQSANALAYKAGFTSEQGKVIFEAYHKGAPYVKPTMNAIAFEAQSLGFITTIIGRRTRFNLWEPERNFDEKAPALPYQAAIAHYGPAIVRAFAYRAVNYRLQGSAAEVIKRAMLKAWQDGIFDVTGVPLLQVHDELDFSEIDDTPAMQEAWRHLEYTLENSTPLRIPVKVDVKTGPTWGDID